MNNNLISVIIPIYNVEKYLNKCISSVINQTYKNLEIVLVDDGSTDSCGVVCDRFAAGDKRIKVVHKKNEGLVRARKTGLEFVTGDYCLNLDGDDWIDERMVALLYDEVGKDGTLDLVQCNYVEEGGCYTSRFGSFRLNTVTEDSKYEFFLDWIGNNEKLGSQIFTKLIKTDLFRECYSLVPDYMNLGEDMICFMNILSKINRICSIDNVLYHYTIRKDSISHNQDLALLFKEGLLNSYLYMLIIRLFPFFSRADIENWFFNRNYSKFNQYGLISKKYKILCVNKFYNKKICLYGAGAVGQSYYNQLVKYQKINIVSWVDKNPSACNFDYFDVKPVDIISGLDFDYILIAVLKKDLADSIREDLVQRGILENKILWEKPETFFY